MIYILILKYTYSMAYLSSLGCKYHNVLLVHSLVLVLYNHQRTKKNILFTVKTQLLLALFVSSKILLKS